MKHLTIAQLSESNAPELQSRWLGEGLRDRGKLFKRYIDEQTAGARVVLVALVAGEPAGYLTVVWESDYPPFERDKVPEINDFNVLPSVRRRGIGTALMDNAENVICDRSSEAGIGVGMFSDYGAAQKMYVLRGYVPDGLGVTSHNKRVRAGDSVVMDDDLVLWFRKSLAQAEESQQ